jgi:hypothetical protein
MEAEVANSAEHQEVATLYKFPVFRSGLHAGIVDKLQ